MPPKRRPHALLASLPRVALAFALAPALALGAASACSLTTIPDLTSGPVGEGGTAGGGGDGAADGGDASSAPFCATAGAGALVCDDFDGDPDLGKRWSEVRAYDGTYGVAVDSTRAHSAPNSLLSRVGPGAPDCAYATLQEDAAGSFSGTRLAYWVHVAAASDLPGKSSISAQSIGGGNALCQVFLTATTGSLVVSEQVIHADGRREEADYDVKPALPIGAWTSVVIDQDLAAKRLSVTLDGVVALAVPTSLACPYAPGGVSANVGLFCEPAANTTRRASFDDVVFSAR